MCLHNDERQYSAACITHTEKDCKKNQTKNFAKLGNNIRIPEFFSLIYVAAYTSSVLQQKKASILLPFESKCFSEGEATNICNKDWFFLAKQ